MVWESKSTRRGWMCLDIFYKHLKLWILGCRGMYQETMPKERAAYLWSTTARVGGINSLMCSPTFVHWHHGILALPKQSQTNRSVFQNKQTVSLCPSVCSVNVRTKYLSRPSHKFRIYEIWKLGFRLISKRPCCGWPEVLSSTHSHKYQKAQFEPRIFKSNRNTGFFACMELTHVKLYLKLQNNRFLPPTLLHGHIKQQAQSRHAMEADSSRKTQRKSLWCATRVKRCLKIACIHTP